MFLQGPHDWVVMEAEVLHSGPNARRTREWSMATSKASAMTGFRTVAAAHELMKFCLRHFLCNYADDMGVSAGLLSRVPWCFVVGVLAPLCIVCDKPSFRAQHLPSRGCG